MAQGDRGPYRRYTKTQKVKAVALAAETSTLGAAEALGIPEKTLEYWVKDPVFAELRESTREQQREGYRIIIAKAQERLAVLIPTMEPRDLTVLLGVSQDKDLLLSGDATLRTESRRLSEGYTDDEKRRLRDWIDGLIATPDTPTAGATEGTGSPVRE